MKLVCDKWVPQDMVSEPRYCLPPKPSVPKPRPPAEPTALKAVAQLTLPVNAPQIGPKPDQNRWGMIPVGYPVWMWTNGSSKLTRTVTQDGLTVNITATRQQVAFNMGDGVVVCKTFTVRPAHLTNDPMQRSPTCGYVYQTPGKYTVSATTTWLIDWTATGQTGQFTVTDTATSSTPLTIGELYSVIVDRQFR